MIYLPIAVLSAFLVFLVGCGGHAQNSPAAPGRQAAIQFTDVTRSAGISFAHSHGGNGCHYYIETMGPGCAFLDYNNDGWLDILFLQGAPLPETKLDAPLHPVLYRNNKNGTFTDVTTTLGLAREIYGLGVAVGDFNNDNWPDFYLTALNGNHLFQNDKGENFTDVTETAGVQGKDMSTTPVWLDYNLDGYLDLFVGRYMDYDLMTNPRCKDALGRPSYCTPHVYKPTHSVLYRNDRDGTFSDVTEPSGIKKAHARAMGVASADFNEDGWIDILVASDLSANLLFLNNGNGTFQEWAGLSGVAYSELGVARAGMGIDCGDYDNDEDLDVIITNFENEPNSLFQNQGKGLFLEQSIGSGIAKASNPFLGWGIKFVDFELDGKLDLFWVNGHVNDYAVETKESLGFKQRAQVLQNAGQNTFTDISEQAGSFFKQKQVGRGAAFGDYDNDGDLDVLIGCNNEPGILLRNDSTRNSHWLQFKLTGRGCNRDALGAKITVKNSDHVQVQFSRSGTSYLSDHDHRLSFGLGQNNHPHVTIRWPCGATEEIQPALDGLTAVEERACLRETHIARTDRPRNTHGF